MVSGMIVKDFIIMLLFNKGMACVSPNEDIPCSEDRGNKNADIFYISVSKCEEQLHIKHLKKALKHNY